MWGLMEIDMIKIGSKSFANGEFIRSIIASDMNSTPVCVVIMKNGDVQKVSFRESGGAEEFIKDLVEQANKERKKSGSLVMVTGDHYCDSGCIANVALIESTASMSCDPLKTPFCVIVNMTNGDDQKIFFAEENVAYDYANGIADRINGG